MGQHLKMILQTRLSPLQLALKKNAAQTEDDQSRKHIAAFCDRPLSSSLFESYNTQNTQSTGFDSMLTAPVLPVDSGIWQDDFGDYLQQFFWPWFGQQDIDCTT